MTMGLIRLRSRTFATMVALCMAAGCSSSTSRAAEPPSGPAADAAKEAGLTLAAKADGWQVAATGPLTLKPQEGEWNLAKHDSLYLTIRNPGEEPATVWAKADNPDASGITNSCRSAIEVRPGKTQVLRLRLMRRPVDPTYAPFKPFFMYTRNINVKDGTIDPAAVARVVVWLEPAKAGQSVLVVQMSAGGDGVPAPVPFFPWVDKYGQYKHTDWPDKIYTDADFPSRLAKEKAEMSAYPGAPDWDRYGGWKNGPKQKATGFFYAAKVDKKWWLVDPEGNLFWSYGPTGVGTGGEGTPVTAKESWFDELPSRDGPFGEYWGKGKGARYMYYQDGKPWDSYSFGSANAQRKYGKDWRDNTADLLHQRLRNWGFNTIANWSDPKVFLQDRTPYTATIHYGGPKLDHIPDVFSPEFESTVRKRMEDEKGKTAGDPWNIGYFVDNELAWSYMNGAEGAIRGALKAEPTSATKIALIADLKQKYADIAALNSAWGTSYASWDAMLNGRDLPEAKNAGARSADLGAFGLKFAERYFTVVRDAVKAVAPNNLYLGCRFHGHIDTAIVAVAAKYVDVVSWNVYEEPGGRLNRFIGQIDKPFIVGEFGIGSDILQTPFRGNVPSEDPMNRVRAMENWVRAAALHPLLVGGHFFQFRDQPITGRGDGEAVLRGFVNTADTPHFELVQANRRLGYNLYTMRGTGKVITQWTAQPLRGMVGVGTWATQAQYKDIKVTSGRKTLLASDFAHGLEGWRVSGGKWDTADGVLSQSSDEEGARVLIGDPTWSDYTLTLKARKTGGKEGFLIIVGSSGDQTKTWWNLGGWGNKESAIQIPGYLNLPSVPMTIQNGRWYDIRVELQGPTIKCYLDGKLIQEATR